MKTFAIGVLFVCIASAARRPQPQTYGIVRLNDGKTLVVVDQLDGSASTWKIGPLADISPSVPVTMNSKSIALSAVKKGQHIRVDVDTSTLKVTDILVLNVANPAASAQAGKLKQYGPGQIAKWEPKKNRLKVKIGQGTTTFQTNGGTKVVQGGVTIRLNALKAGETVTVSADPATLVASKIVIP